MEANGKLPQSRSSVYEIVTEQIIRQLESGVAPWHRPWTTQMPKNLVSKREYRGINVFLLASHGYGSPYWLTYKQAFDLGGNVRRGEHGSKVVFWKIDKYEAEDADGQMVAKTSAILRYYTVFKLADKYRPQSIGEFIGLEKPKHIMEKFAVNPYPSDGNAPDLARLAKESRNNVRDALMKLELELMAL